MEQRERRGEKKRGREGGRVGEREGGREGEIGLVSNLRNLKCSYGIQTVFTECYNF